MATVTELKHGLWVVQWSTNAANSTQNIQCGQTTLQLTSSINTSLVTLSLKEGKEFRDF
jgi:hypothetical protein